MLELLSLSDRRRFLKHVAFGAAAFSTPGLFAEQLSLTPAQTEGPFYPDKLPLDTDNDLLVINDGITPAVGEVTHLTGRILSAAGEPVRNAVVEIWQVDHNGAYLHTGTSNADKRDTNFQGFGRFLTDSQGRYYFRTVKPVPYPGRTPHIHFAIEQKGRRMLTTQCYVKGEPQNDRDGIFNRLGASKSLVEVDFQPLPESKIGELAANFDIVIGMTPEDADEGGSGAPPRGPGGPGGPRPPQGQGAGPARPPR
jgi:protocatechuate 3,4-dioxygenase beta subunit